MIGICLYNFFSRQDVTVVGPFIKNSDKGYLKLCDNLMVIYKIK